jgi:glycosyltransferase involved in cell wall biosynthesis
VNDDDTFLGDASGAGKVDVDVRPLPEPVGAGARPRYSIIVGVYRNAPTLPAVVEALADLSGELDGALEVVFVIDGSPDRSYAILRELLPTAPFASQLISLSRNFGANNTQMFGLGASRGDFVANMAADLQEPVTLIRDMFAALSSGEYDIAVGVRTERHDPLTQTLNAKIFWFFYRRLVQPELPEGGVSVYGCTRQVVNELIRLEESHSNPIGLLYWLGFRRVEVPYVRGARAEGKSSWTFAMKVRSLADSVYSFTDLPVTVITTIGALGVVVSFVFGVLILIAASAGNIPVRGYASLMLVLVAIGSSVLLSLGVIGSYVWRTYENTKQRPVVIPMSRETFEPGSNVIG